MRRAGAGALVAMLAAVLLLTGCGIRVPTDPGGSLDRVQGTVLRAGASLEPGLVEIDGRDVSGPLAALVADFARTQDAEVDWTVGSEESLVVALEEGRLDVVVGGMTSDTPWADRVGVSRGYRGITGADGRELVLLVPLGENRLLSALETFLDGRVGG